MGEFEKSLDKLGISLPNLDVKMTAKGWKIFSPEVANLPSRDNDSFGILAIRGSGKPTTFFLRIFHNQVKRRVEVDKVELGKLLNGEGVRVDAENGWLLVVWRGIPIGCGLVKNKILRIEIPKDDIIRMRAGYRNIR